MSKNPAKFRHQNVHHALLLRPPSFLLFPRKNWYLVFSFLAVATEFGKRAAISVEAETNTVFKVSSFEALG